jgi:hypothetical protein
MMKRLLTTLCLPAILLCALAACAPVLRQGQGTYTWPDGAKYVGEYKDGKAHGQGTGTFADGRVWIGLFSDNNFVSGKKYAAGEAPSSGGPRHSPV